MMAKDYFYIRSVSEKYLCRSIDILTKQKPVANRIYSISDTTSKPIYKTEPISQLQGNKHHINFFTSPNTITINDTIYIFKQPEKYFKLPQMSNPTFRFSGHESSQFICHIICTIMFYVRFIKTRIR